MKTSYTPLPKYIQVYSPIMMLMVAEYIEVVLGVERGENAKLTSFASPDTSPADNGPFWNVTTFNLRLYTADQTGGKASCSYYNNSSMTHIPKNDVWRVKDMKDLFDLVHGPSWPIGEYVARISDEGNGINVGCTFVPWETIREIAKYMPAEVVPQPPAPEPAPDTDPLCF